MPDISDVTATGWVKDHILTKEIIKTLDATDEPDYIYTISVQGHGDYPTEPVSQRSYNDSSQKAKPCILIQIRQVSSQSCEV